MKVVRPVTITDAILNSSTAAEPGAGETAWNSGTTYAAAAEVYLTSTHRRYRSVQASNTNHNPAADTTATWWLDIGPTNRWAMFDSGVGTITTQVSPLTVELDPGQSIDTIALLDVAAATVQCVMIADAVSVYDQTVDMTSLDTVTDWYEYFFDPITRRTTVIFNDLPPYPNGVVTITSTEGGGGAVSIGTCVIGRRFRVGGTKYGASAGITDFSRKATDDFGVTTVVERPYADRMDVVVDCVAGATDQIKRTLASLRATPVVWIGGEGVFDALVAYGFYKSFNVELTSRLVSHCSLSIEGLT